MNGIWPDDLIKRAEETDTSPVLRDKLKDISLVYASFQKMLEGKYLDSDDYLKNLIQKIPTTSFLRNSRIIIDGFDFFTEDLYAVI